MQRNGPFVSVPLIHESWGQKQKNRPHGCPHGCLRKQKDRPGKEENT